MFWFARKSQQWKLQNYISNTKHIQRLWRIILADFFRNRSLQFRTKRIINPYEMDRHVPLKAGLTMTLEKSLGWGKIKKCERGESNPHGRLPTRPWTWRVYQFHHFRTMRLQIYKIPFRKATLSYLYFTGNSSPLASWREQSHIFALLIFPLKKLSPYTFTPIRCRQPLRKKQINLFFISNGLETIFYLSLVKAELSD